MDYPLTRAMRRRHCVGSCAPVNFGRRRAVGPKKSAAARRGRPQTFFKGPRKHFVLFSKFSDDLFLVIDRKLQENMYTSKMASAGRRQFIDVYIFSCNFRSMTKKRLS